MSAPYRPTVLKLAIRHCPAAVDAYTNNVAAFRDHFGTGIAGHAVLEHFGRLTAAKNSALMEAELRAAAETMVAQLLAKGRVFDNKKEPPLRPDQIIEGAALALRWAIEHPLSPTAKYELGVGFTRDWKPCRYDAKECRFRLIFDVFDRWEEADEETAAEGVAHTDYKSAWSADETELFSIQMKAQSVAAWLCASIFGNESPAFIRREIINLRTNESLATTLWMDDNGKAQIEAWKRELTAHMDALDAMPSPRPARPGHGCMGCPWVLSCESAKEFLTEALATVDTPMDRVSLGRAYCVAQSQRDQLFALMKEATEEGAVDVGDGVMVGTIAKPAVAPESKALRQAWDEWAKRGGDAEGFTTALKPGVEQLRALAKVMAPRKPIEQDELLLKWLRDINERRFGIYRNPPATNTKPSANDEAATDAA